VTFSDGFELFNGLVYIFFYIDILICFTTGYTDERGEYITDHKKIAADYMRTWFWIDFLSNIPLDYIMAWGKLFLMYLLLANPGSDENSGSYLRILRVSKTLRLMRAVKLRQTLDNLAD